MVDSSNSGERLMGSVSSSSSTSGVSHLVGRTVGHYKITGLIAQGGMGAVYEAHHTRLNRMVALKVMLPGMDSSSEDVQRFLREAHAAARLSHPNLVPIYDVGDSHGVRYLAMELVRGDTLHTLIRRRGQLPESLALELVMGSARGLQHAHEQGVLHRDLKPANIIVQQDGTPRLTDFGVAKAIGASRLTATGTALGTPQYMSPEQAMGLNEELDARTDIYGLGAILYECLTGQPPFNEGSHVGTMNAVVNDKPVPPSKRREELSEGVEAICLKCLRKNPEDRYASANELVVDIEAFLRGKTIRANAPSAWRRLTRKLRRNAAVSVLVAVCAAVFLAFLSALAIPTIHDRRVAQLERRARTILLARVAEETRRVEAAAHAQDTAALEAVLVRLDPVTLATSLRDELGAGEEPDARLACERGLDDLLAQVGPPAAKAALALAELNDGEAQLEWWARAALHDPQGPSGRAARLAMARRLRAEGVTGPLLEAELEDLARGDGVLSAAALLELAEARGARWRWRQVAGLLAALDTEALPAPLRARAEGLRVGARVFGGATEVPRYRLATALPGDGEARLALIDDKPNLHLLGAPHGPEGALRELQVLPIATPISRMAAGDLDGDGEAELILSMRASDSQRTYLYAHDPTNLQERWVLWEEDAARLQDLAVGELDGETGEEVVVLLRGVTPQLRVCGGARKDARPYTLDGINAWGTSCAELVDLDGDGIDELAVGCTDAPSGLALVRVGAERLEPVLPEPLALGKVTRLRSCPKGRRSLLLAVVDFGADDLDRAGDVPPGPAWTWRDGVYVVGWVDGGPQLVGRWTYGPDQPPSREDAQATARITAWTFDLDGQAWVARLATVDGQRVLEATPLGSLSLDSIPEPALRLVLQNSWQSFDPGVAVLDVDRDGDFEQLLGTSLGPVGEPSPLPWIAPDPARETTHGERLLTVVRHLYKLKAPELARRFLDQLGEVSGSLAASGQLARVDSLLERGVDEEARARRAFVDRDPARGRELHEASLSLLREAGELAREVARDGRASLAAQSRGWRQAVFAFERACEEPKALATLREATESALPPDLRDSFNRRAKVLEAWETLGQTELTSSTTLLASSLFTIQRADSSLMLRCESDTHVEVSAPLDLGKATLPLALEAELEIPSGAWASRLFLGLKRPKTTLDPQAPEQLIAGFALSLWDVKTGMLGITTRAGAHRDHVKLPGFPQRLRLRLELLPVGSGTRISLWVWSRGELVHSSIKTRQGLQIPQRVLLAASSPRFPTQEGVVVPQGFALGTWVTVKRLTLSTARAQPINETISSTDLLALAAHGSILSGRTDWANSLYSTLLKQPATKAEYVEGCLGAFAAGSANPKLVSQAIQYDPYTALKILEDASEALSDGRPELLARVRAALDAAADSQDANVRLVVGSLRGDHFQGAIPPELNAAYASLTPVLRRLQLRAYAARQPETVRSQLAKLRSHEWVRMPLVRRIPPATPLAPSELAQLLGQQASHCDQCREDLLFRQRATAQTPEQLAPLAQAFQDMGHSGEWERTTLRLLGLTEDAKTQRSLLLDLAEYHRSRGHAGQLADAVSQLAQLETPPRLLEPFRGALGEARFNRAVGQD